MKGRLRDARERGKEMRGREEDLFGGEEEGGIRQLERRRQAQAEGIHEGRKGKMIVVVDGWQPRN